MVAKTYEFCPQKDMGYGVQFSAQVGGPAKLWVMRDSTSFLKQT